MSTNNQLRHICTRFFLLWGVCVSSQGVRTKSSCVACYHILLLLFLLMFHLLSLLTVFKDVTSILFPASPPESVCQEVLMLWTGFPGLADMQGYVQGGDQDILLLARHACSWAERGFQIDFNNLHPSVCRCKSPVSPTYFWPRPWQELMGWLPVRDASSLQRDGVIT